MTLPVDIDLRGLAVDRRADQLREAVRALRPGEVLVLTSDADLRELLAHLRADEVTSLEYGELEQTGHFHSVEVRLSAGERSLEEKLAWEHARLDKLLSDVEWRVQQRQVQDAVEHFDRFTAALRVHLRLEDESLFPAYERAVGDGAATLTTRLRAQRDVLLSLVSEIARGLRAFAEEGYGALRALSDLRDVLAPHRCDEVQTLAPRLSS